MSNIEIGPSRPVGAVQVKIATADTAAPQAVAEAPASPSAAATAAPSAPATIASAASATVATSGATRAGDVPVSSDRVAQIRKAIEEGHYPVIPAQIADAMIAAGMLLRTPQ
ncbi:flagellar biosynthesis anti-sigma factor FlgM [Novosphingobium sp. SG720]|uniref:flagellar biosynthesis anti-sigma factor FlgM n=1 Tax=Novosphingobium sp. SG720 TaxID=2586998 RepID=UPI001444D91C|nr:flagellar biosynthesis anti-sigma factor FlgM [Novosphingobium sp. SG720]NKJ40737.1 negative regulator of flagellin synthesis FlgM [Novosphingobium sp. SG720]